MSSVNPPYLSNLSNDAAKRLPIALADVNPGNEVASAVNAAIALGLQTGVSVPAAIVCTHNDTTTDFGVLAVNDLVVHVPASAGNSSFAKVTTAGTNPIGAGVIGDLYVVLRVFVTPAPSTFSF